MPQLCRNFLIEKVIGGRILAAALLLLPGPAIDLDGSARSRITRPYARGGIAQTFATTLGKRYRVTFDLAGNPNRGPTKKPVRISAAGQSTDLIFDGTGKTSRNMGWVPQTWTFTATGDSTTLEFTESTLRPAATAALEQLAALIRDHPDLPIRSRGTPTASEPWLPTSGARAKPAGRGEAPEATLELISPVSWLPRGIPPDLAAENLQAFMNRAQGTRLAGRTSRDACAARSTGSTDSRSSSATRGSRHSGRSCSGWSPRIRSRSRPGR